MALGHIGAAFLSKEVAVWFLSQPAKELIVYYTVPYHPTSNGDVRIFIFTVEAMLAQYWLSSCVCLSFCLSLCHKSELYKDG